MLEKLPFNIVIPPPIEKCVRIAKILMNDVTRCDLLKHASAMAYVTLFSLVPSLAATFGLISLFKPFLGEDSALLTKAKTLILENLATGTGENLVAYLESFLANLDMKKIGLTGIAGMIVTLILLLRQIEIALNRIWLVQKPRNALARFIYFWTFITLGTVIVGLAIGLSSGFDLTSLNPFGEDVQRGFMTRLVPFFATVIFFALLYKIVPNCFVSFKEALSGAIPAAILFTLASRFYGWYTANFTNYQALYGALAALPLFLMWLYILWLITLLGSLLAWRTQQSYDVDDEVDDQAEGLSPQDRMRNHQLQAMTPLTTLLAIYQSFSEAKGQGVTGQQIASKLNLPTQWVSESIETLLELNYIIAAQNNDSEGSNYLQSAYFPTYPPDSLKLSEISETLRAPTNQWLSDWEHEWPVDIRAALAKLWESQKPDTGSKSLSEFMRSYKAS